MIDWKSDPEFKALWESFVASFPVRLAKLKILRLCLGMNEDERALKDAQSEIKVLAHSLAGSAGTYTFKVLGEIAGNLEDYLGADGERAPAEVFSFTGLLEEALVEAIKSAADPVGFWSDPRCISLISAVESLLGAAKPESS
jgi:HPt (histidine-containing phosphotransfer) domain-containing protein